jgi:predicted component of type VI protein secretion system
MNLPSGIHRADDAEINFNSRPKMIQMREDRLLLCAALIVRFPFSSVIKVLSLNKGSRFMVWRIPDTLSFFEVIPMKVSLVVAQGKRKGKVIPIHGGRFVIGRHKECDLKANGSTISQHHCAILIRDGKAFVRDFDSTNGTYVNHERVQGEQRELVQDDLLQLGRLAFRVRIEPGDEEEPAPSGKADESMVAAMLLEPSDSTDSAGILGLLEDSKCGSTIMPSPLQDDDVVDEPESASRSDQNPIHPEKSEEKEIAATPLGQSDEIAKKLLEELHRSVRAKHNRPEPS